MFGFSQWELLIILVIALLVFGRRLPEVGKSLGKGIIEFKKGLKGVEDEMHKAESAPDRSAYSNPDRSAYNENRPQIEAPAPTDPRRVSRADQVEHDSGESTKA